MRLIETGNAVALLPGFVHIGAAHRLRLVELPGKPRREVFTAARISSVDHPALAAVREALRREAEVLVGG